jgi:hypothetical protein
LLSSQICTQLDAVANVGSVRWWSIPLKAYLPWKVKSGWTSAPQISSPSMAIELTPARELEGPASMNESSESVGWEEVDGVEVGMESYSDPVRVVDGEAQILMV